MASSKTKQRRPPEKRAAAKPAPAKGKDEAPEKDAPETPDSPLLDLSDAAVRKMIKLAKKRGWVTHDQINGKSSGMDPLSNLRRFPRRVAFMRHYHQQIDIRIRSRVTTRIGSE